MKHTALVYAAASPPSSAARLPVVICSLMILADVTDGGTCST